MANFALIGKVLEQITGDDPRHDQTAWVKVDPNTGCVTSMCTYGWAAHIETGLPYDEAHKKLAARYGIDFSDGDEWDEDIQVDIGAQLFDVPSVFAEKLFTCRSEAAVIDVLTELFNMETGTPPVMALGDDYERWQLELWVAHRAM